VRVDSGVREGAEVGVHYDPLVAKVIVHAESRPAAIARAIAALRQFPILGVRTNVPFLIRLLDDAEFRAGSLHTRSIDERLSELLPEELEPPPHVLAVASARSATSQLAIHGAAQSPADDPWDTLGGWR
jgi:3-methylcrotonyl-CoA carboxylase alpha subunit